MKTHLLLITIMLLSLTGITQSRNDNTVIIPDFTIEQLKDVENALIKNFFQIALMDYENGRFSTEPKPLQGGVFATDIRAVIHGFVDGNRLVLYANYEYTANAQKNSGRAFWTRRQGTWPSVVFHEMLNVVEQLNQPFTYAKL